MGSNNAITGTSIGSGVMNIQSTDVQWLAGYLEGEGCFTWASAGKNQHSYPRISVCSIDQDVIERVTHLFQASIYTRAPHGNRQRTYHCHHVCGRAVGWMMTLYKFLGKRRQTRIREVLALWRSIPSSRATKPAIARYWHGEEKRRGDNIKLALPRVMARCHPQKAHCAHGFCRKCYEHERYVGRLP